MVIRIINLLSLILPIYFVAFPGFSQDTQIKFQNIGTTQGLSQSNVVCIIQDKRGFMWFGTRNGLNKYNGYDFTHYKKNSKINNSLNNDNINGLLEGSDGNIWIATWGGGINVFDPKKEKFTAYKINPENEENNSDNYIMSIYEDKRGNIWVGTASGGLSLFDKKSKTFKTYVKDVNNPKSISSNSVWSIFEDRNNNLWIGTESGGLNLFDRDKEEFSSIQHDPKNPNSLSHNFTRKIFEDSKGNLWIGTYGGGLNLMNPDKKTFTHFKKGKDSNSISHNNLISLNEDEEGNIWIGSENGGLDIYYTKTKKFKNYKNSKADNTSLSNNSVYSIYKDIKGNMWVGTYSGGVNLFNNDGIKFNHYKHNSSSNSLSENTVFCIMEDSEQNIWIGTDGGGMNLMDKNTHTFTHFKHDENNINSISGNHVLGLVEDSEKNIWIGTWGSGLTVFDRKNNKYKRFTHNPSDSTSLGSNNCWAVFEDKDKDILIGTFYGGLSLYDKKSGTFKRYSHNPKDYTTISNNNIYVIFQDSRDNIWIGTDGGGLNLFDKKNGTFTRYLYSEHINSISNNIVNCIFEDGEGMLWISTDAGLNKFNPNTNVFVSYNEDDGLPNNMIFGILEDINKNLWLSTSKGISKFNPRTIEFENYSVADGLQHDEFRRQAYCKSASGLLYFGGNNGFNEFDPQKIMEKPYDPPLVFTGFQLFNKTVPILDEEDNHPVLTKHITYTDKVVLSHEHSVLTIDFATLNYTIDEKKKYAYKLEGFDKDWNEIGSKRSLSYTNLDPGQYTLMIKGFNNQGQWSENMAQLGIVVTPPFWKTWWFRGMGILFLLSCFATFFHVRMKIIQNQKRILEAQVKERTAEVLKQKEEIQDQRITLEELYLEVKDSIRAAQNIQQSILPPHSLIKKHIPHCFVLNRPKDVVSGDFYWFNEFNGKIVIAVVDCTGHGISGAFMSINGHHLLNQAIHPQKELVASEILDRLNEGLIKELHQMEDGEDGMAKEGMDIALCILDKDTNVLQYAGANNPLYLIRNNELIQIKANRFAIGLSISKAVSKFTNHVIPLEKDDVIYIFTDGYADQFGGPTGDSKFMYAQFRNLLLDIHKKDMEIQAQIMDTTLNNWRKDVEQLDDILIMGVRI